MLVECDKLNNYIHFCQPVFNLNVAIFCKIAPLIMINVCVNGIPFLTVVKHHTQSCNRLISVVLPAQFSMLCCRLHAALL
jgi:hypothetical protein